MKVLMISNFADGTGWGNAAQSIIIALDTAGVDVVARAITYNNFAGHNDINPIVANCVQKELDGVDTIIQHCFPTEFVYKEGYKNIGSFYFETTSPPTSWKNGISMMDQIIVPDNNMLEGIEHDNVHKCGLSLNFEEYQNVPDCQIEDLQMEGCFNFCFVGELLNKRKNLTALLKAFHTEFHPSENVNLFLQANKPGQAATETLSEIEHLNSKITNGLRIRQNYKKIIISAGKLPKSDMLSIMKNCHCFVCPSYGEAWCIPGLEAMALGMPTIFTESIALGEFSNHLCQPVRCTKEPCYGVVDSLPHFYTAHDEWRSINIRELQLAMRRIYDVWKNEDWKKVQGYCKDTAMIFNHHNIGNQLKEILCQ